MKCLITGSTGLIGREVLFNLQKEYEIIRLVRRKEKEGPEIPNCCSIDDDLRNIVDLSKLPDHVDYVIHLAQSEHHRYFPEYAQEMFSVNTSSTAQLLEYARKAGVKNFILVSSGGVYGYSPKALSESEKIVVEPRGFYLGTKLCSEILAKAYEDLFNVIILRPFFVYGKNQRNDMLMPRLINSIRKEETISLEGEGGVFINPIHVIDAAKAISMSIKLNESKTINVGGPEILSLREICSIIGEELNLKPRFNVIDSTKKLCIGEITEMKKLLWRPRISFKEGIKSMIGE